MKYLGLCLDSHWRFNAHFDRLVLRLRGEITNFGRLLPNLGTQGTDAAVSIWRWCGPERGTAL